MDRHSEHERRHQDAAVAVERRQLDRRAAGRSLDRMHAVFAVREFLVVGEVANHGHRLLEVLNDPASDFVAVKDAQVFHAGTLIDTLPQAIIPKSRLSLAALPGVDHEASDKRQLCRQSKTLFSAFVLVDDFAIKGMFHSSGSGDSFTAYTHEFTEFFAVANATVTNLFKDGRPVPVQVAIAHKPFVSLVHIGEAPENLRNSASEAPALERPAAPDTGSKPDARSSGYQFLF